jgi:hypothetical protein
MYARFRPGKKWRFPVKSKRIKAMQVVTSGSTQPESLILAQNERWRQA